jgi:ABC-type uncharacterized transport system ATPase subunit
LAPEDSALLAGGLNRARSELHRLETEYELRVDPEAITGELPVGLQQRVEILKALYRSAEVLILDEPTGVLTPAEADHLFKILEVLKNEGKTILLITHKLREIMAATDDGVGHAPRRDGGNPRNQEHLNGGAGRADGRAQRACCGSTRNQPSPKRPFSRWKTSRCADSRGVEVVKNVSFKVHEGEIVGIAGVSGNGQSELLETLSGIPSRHPGYLENQR